MADAAAVGFSRQEAYPHCPSKVLLSLRATLSLLAKTGEAPAVLSRPRLPWYEREAGKRLVCPAVAGKQGRRQIRSPHPRLVAGRMREFGG
jgi:hypothetical protein